MSLASKVTFFSACGLSIGIVAYVHIKQWADKKKLHEGVIRDVQKQQRKKVENLYFLQQQIEMKKMLEKQQKEDDAVALKLLEESRKNTS